MKFKFGFNLALLLLLLGLQSQVSVKRKTQEEMNEILGNTSAKSIADVITGNLTIRSSFCVGIDCVDAEAYGFDTQRLKANNIQIHFEDTSNPLSFPSNDWRILINDDASGGGNYFAVNDATSSRTPFLIEAGARTSALYVESDGDIGIGTSNPVLDLDIQTGNTPAIRINQDASSGFAAQTWDMAGNETNFFVRDATNGSKLPFRIQPNSPSSSIFIKPSVVEIKNVALFDPTTPSDLRLKHNIESIKDATQVILKLEPKTYNYTAKAQKEYGYDTRTNYGLIAQSVEKVLPELIKELPLGDKNEMYKTVKYEALIPILIQGFKEQEIRIKQLENELKAYSYLEKRLQALESASKTSNAKR